MTKPRQFLTALGSCLVLLAVLFLVWPSASLAQPVLPPPPPPSTPGTLVINLPSRELLKPSQLKIGTHTFNFNINTGQPTPSTQGGYTVTVTTHDAGTRSEGYIITVNGFAKGGGQLAKNQRFGGLISKLNSLVTAQAYNPPPAGLIPLLNTKFVYPYRLTFAGSLAKATVTDFVTNYVLPAPQSNNLSDTYVGDDQCVRNAGGTNLCIREHTTFTTTERGATGPLYLIQAVPLGITGTITIQGNAAAARTIGGFSFSNTSNAFAIGGTISGTLPNASKELSDYINQSSTKFSWTNVQPKLTTLFNKRTKGTTYTAGTLQGSTWHLNAPGTDPTDSATTSFSTPPEGKLWNVNGALTLPATTFTGSGTIAVQGNVVFNGNVTCTNGTRLGIIASGSITFNGSTIGCGAYTALGGNIDFNFQVASGNPIATGIFVAQDSIRLPALNVDASYTIQYDNLFGSNPTVLYQDLLQVVFSTTS